MSQQERATILLIDDHPMLRTERSPHNFPKA